MALPLVPIALGVQALSNILSKRSERKAQKQAVQAEKERIEEQRRQDLINNLLGFASGRGFQGFSPVEAQPVTPPSSGLADLLAGTSSVLGGIDAERRMKAARLNELADAAAKREFAASESALDRAARAELQRRKTPVSPIPPGLAQFQL